MKNKAVWAAIGVALAGLILRIISDDGPIEFSNPWFDSLSDEELLEEREKVRQRFCSSGSDSHQAIKWQSLLRIFDDKMRRRAQNEDEEYVYPKHSEHGWYLSDDD